MAKTNRGVKGLFQLTVMGGSQGRNLAAEMDAKKVEECQSLLCLPWLVQFAFLYHSGPTAQGQHCLKWAELGSPHAQTNFVLVFLYMRPFVTSIKMFL